MSPLKKLTGYSIMIPWPRLGIIPVVVLLAWSVSAVFTPSCLMFPAQISAADFSDRIVAIVNKEVITKSELQAELDDDRKRLRARYQGEELTRRIAQKEYETLNDLIERKVQIQEAKAKGFSVTSEEVEQALKQVSSKDPSHQPPNSSMRKQVHDRLLLDKLWDFEIRRTVMVPDSEVTQYYEEHRDEFLIPPTYRLRQILLLARPGQEEAERQSRADSLYQAVRANENFAELALKYSDGPEAAEGGVLGILRQDELLEPIAQALKTMNPGDISKPIRTTLGFHIIALDEVTSPKARPLEDVENSIKSFLYKKRTEATFQRWLANLKKKAFIEIKFHHQ